MTAVAAVVAGWMAEHERRALKKACGDAPCPRDKADDIRFARRMAHTSTALTGSSLLLAGGALLTWRWHVKDEDEGTVSRSASLSVGPTKVLVRVKGEF